MDPEAVSSTDQGAEFDLDSAIRLHRSGHFQDAERIYQALLVRDAGHAATWHAYGVMLAESGRVADALPCIERALQLQPEEVEYQRNYLSICDHLSLPSLSQAARAMFECSRPQSETQVAAASVIPGHQSSIETTYAEPAALEMQALDRFCRSKEFQHWATALAGHILRSFPRAIGAWKALALIAMTNGKREDAVDVLRRCREIAPEDAESCLALADLLISDGRYVEARQVLVNDEVPEAKRIDVLLRLIRIDRLCADYDAAMTRCAHSLAMTLSSEMRLDILIELGLVQLESGQVQAAIVSFGQALAMDEKNLELLCHLGESYKRLTQFELAAKCYEDALRMNPAHAVALNNLGDIYRELGRHGDAERAFRNAIALDAAYAHPHLNLAIMLHSAGMIDDAESQCRRALEIDPAFVQAMVLLGELHADKGQFQQAESCYRQALSEEPDNPEALAAMSRTRKMSQADVDWKVQVERILDTRLPRRQEIYLRFALAKYYEDTAQYDEAFYAYRKANQLAAQSLCSYQADHHEAAISNLIEAYGAPWFDAVRGKGQDSSRPVFVIGMPRSGTSLVEQILASHGQVYGAGELSYWGKVLVTHETAMLTRTEEPSSPSELAAEYLLQIEKMNATCRYVIDKMPGNFLAAGLIHAALPNAKFIHMQRNPIDTCLSIYFQNFETPHVYSHDLEHLAHYFGQYRRLMAHWRELLPAGTLLEVPYEALVDNHEQWVSTLLNFLDLPWDERCLTFHDTQRNVNTASKWQVRQKLNRDSIEKWKRYERHVGPLIQLLEA